MKVEIYSKETMENALQTGFPANTAVISFHDTLDDPIEFGAQIPHMTICAEDCYYDDLADYGLEYDTYLPEANAIAEFIKAAHSAGMDINCQCHYGQSRSAACAAAIREYFYGDGITLFADYRYCPNQMVFNKIYAALKGTP